MDQRDRIKHFPIPKISPIANEDTSCIIEEFEESEKEEEKFEKYAIEPSSSPPQSEMSTLLQFEPTSKQRRKPRRSKRPKVDKHFFEDHNNVTDPDSDSPERHHIIKKIFRKSAKTFVEDESVKATARQVASLEGCPRLFAPKSPGFFFEIETYPSPVSKGKMCRNLYPEDDDNSLVEDMQEFLSSSSKIKKRSKQNNMYAPIKCAILKRVEKPIGTPPKRLKTSNSGPDLKSEVAKSQKSRKKIDDTKLCSSPALQNVEDNDSDLSVVEATPPKIVKKYKVRKKSSTSVNTMSVKEFQSRSLLYSPELKKEFSSNRSSFRLDFPTVEEVDETSPSKSYTPLEPLIKRNDEKTDCVAKKRINFDFLVEEKEQVCKLSILDKEKQDDLGFSICSQIMSAEIAEEPMTPLKEMSQLCIDEYHSPPMSAYYEIENVPSPQLPQIKDKSDTEEDKIVQHGSIEIVQDESDTECDQMLPGFDQIVQDESDNEDKVEAISVPIIHDESDNENEDRNESEEKIEHSDELQIVIQDFSSPDCHPHIQEIDNTSFSEICIRNTEPEQYEVRQNLRPRKKPKPGSMLEKAYNIKSRLEKDSKFFDYELKNGLRSKTGSLVSFPFERLNYIVRDGLFFIFCRPTFVVENTDFVIVAINISEETLSRKFLFLHYPFTVVFNSTLNLTLLLVRNQVHSEDTVDFKNSNTLLKTPSFQRNKFIRTLTTNVTSSVVDIVAAQLFMPDQILNLFILHIFRTDENFCVVCQDDKDFCVLDFREGQIDKVKSRKNMRHGVSIAVTGFQVVNISTISEDFKSILEFASGVNVETDHFYTLTPLGYWDLKTTKRTINKLKMTTSIETVLKENDPNKRYRVNAVFVAVNESGIFISDNLQSQKVKVVYSDNIDFNERRLGILDGALFRNGQFIVDRYTQVISS